MTTIELIRQRLLLPIMLWILHGCIQEINQLAMEYIINSIMRKVHNYHNNLLKLCILTIYYMYAPRKQSLGVHRNHPVCPSVRRLSVYSSVDVPCKRNSS